MSIKLMDEKRRHAGLLKQKIELRKSLFQMCGENKNRMGKIMRKLRKAANEEKGKCRKKGEKKLNHIIEKRKKVETGNDEKIKVPEEIVELDEAKAFNRIEFDKIVIKETEPEVIGKVEIDENEKEALKLHPKFAVRKKLDREQFQLDMECGFAKLRWEIGKDVEEQENTGKKGENRGSVEERKETQSETEEMEEDTARGELVFDPETRTYDARKMKITNLRENTRITLPRPLKPIHEAMIEVRRKEYNRVFDEYRGKESKKRKRVSNLTEEESKGVKSLKSRIEKDEIVVLKTDKSSKLTVMNKEEYRETGEKLREKDRKVNREEIIKRKKTLNEHSEYQPSGEGGAH